MTTKDTTNHTNEERPLHAAVIGDEELAASFHGNTIANNEVQSSPRCSHDISAIQAKMELALAADLTETLTAPPSENGKGVVFYKTTDSQTFLLASKEEIKVYVLELIRQRNGMHVESVASTDDESVSDQEDEMLLAFD